MVLLTLTPAAKAAVAEYSRIKRRENDSRDEGLEEKLERLSRIELGSPVEHHDLIDISAFLVQQCRKESEDDLAKDWRLDSLLKGALVYRPPPPSKPEPTNEYKALMKRLRGEEEQRQYERMLYPSPPAETFSQRLPSATQYSGPSNAAGAFGATDNVEDEVTYADINRQLALIINILVSIIACSVAIWVAARRWEVPQRLGLSMSGSGLVAFAEVAIYMGYIRRIKEAKGKEVKSVEKKEIMETWVLDGAKSGTKAKIDESVRYRKGKHR